ncbi:tyrosine-type recombinase/integrase [Aliiglaciecola sp. 2_MG-2023]|nr:MULTISPECIES: site-specific integrase [unclassified Aliiglaciecola]MDO6710351.1 tyrosine-type recombinase/integrase [Aliiglaciecola sp. 2_MG-2023]MDO6751498.1 tyrosine-type recombinase/integrase [Aliiglaciecola sp. 1_MG-2023]
MFNYLETFPNSRKAQHLFGNTNHRCESQRFNNFSQQWINEMSPSWRLSYRQTVSYLVSTKLNDKFGSCFLSDIKKADILKFRSELIGSNNTANESSQLQLSSSYVNRVIGLLCSILTEASNRFAFSNPALEITPLKVRKKTVLPFSLDEVEKIINGVASEFKDYFIVRFFTGLRTGELHALRWENIKLLERQIIINESIVDGVVGRTKSQSSDRVIHMTDIIHAALNRIAEKNNNHAYVFHRKGKPLTQSFITQSIWYPLLERLNLTRRRPYNTRHTAATLWLSSGENPEWISRQLGHKNTQILFETYSRYVPNLTRFDGSIANKLFNKLEVNL